MKHKNGEERTDCMEMKQTDCRKRERLKYEKNAVKRCTIYLQKEKTAGCARLAYTLLIIWSEHKCKKISVHLRKKEGI